MKLIELAPLKIANEYLYSTHGVFEFRITREQNELHARYNIDTTEPTEKWHELKGLSGNADWRSIIKPMEDEGVASLDIEDGPPPSAFDVEGDLNFASELVVSACTGGRTLRLVHELIRLDDETLGKFREKNTSFLDADFWEKLRGLAHSADECSLPLSSLLKRASKYDFDLDALLLDVEKYEAVLDAEAEAERLRREWALLPFKDEIASILAEWYRQNPMTSMNQSFGVRAAAGGLARYLEEYVGKHLELPKGTHEFDAQIFSKTLRMKVDFDTLT